MGRPLSGSAAIVAALCLLLSACSKEAGPSPSEQAVCRSIQGVMDEIREGRGDGSLASLADLETAVAGAENATFRKSGEQFFLVIGEQVSDAEVTLKEAARRGRQALLAGGKHLGAMVDECGRLGDKVELPVYDADGQRVPSGRS